MNISNSDITRPDMNRTCPERDIWNELLQLDAKHMLELGCGRAEITHAIATGGPGRSMLALEVDTIQHTLHQQISDLPNVEFIMAGAESIPCPANSFDVAFMFKSLHHVPLALMDKAFEEIHRVLKPGGFAYISEPIFAGDFNDILKMFHNEEQVRRAAFEATRRAVNAGLFTLASQTFFNAPMRFADFSEFENKILAATHTKHSLSPELYVAVKGKFETHMSPDGANFLMPIRVDLLQNVK